MILWVLYNHCNIYPILKYSNKKINQFIMAKIIVYSINRKWVNY